MHNKNDVIKRDMENIYSRRGDWDCFNHKTVFITGAYGMLASYFIFFLAYLNDEQGIDVKVIAQGRNPERMKDVFGELIERDYFYECYEDVCNPIHLEGEINYIIHAASIANPRLYSEIPIEVSEPNAIGTYYLLKYATEHRIEGFLLFSSGDVYGKMERACEYITENDMGIVNPLEIHSCYAESKRMAETWCGLFWNQMKVPTKIARIGHTYAPTMDLKNDPRVFSDFVRCILERRDIVMHSDGSAKRPFCYITDAIVAYIMILLDGEPGEAYNVCNTQEFLSVRELAEILISLRPEYGLKVIERDRDKKDKYMENVINKQNRPIEEKLRRMGWICECDTRNGFLNVLDYFEGV